MNFLARDCTGDGLITCDDYAKMHKNGAWGCDKEVAEDWWGRYESCKKVITESGENI